MSDIIKTTARYQEASEPIRQKPIIQIDGPAEVQSANRNSSIDSGRDNPFRPDGPIYKSADPIVDFYKYGPNHSRPQSPTDSQAAILNGTLDHKSGTKETKEQKRRRKRREKEAKANGEQKKVSCWRRWLCCCCSCCCNRNKDTNDNKCQGQTEALRQENDDKDNGGKQSAEIGRVPDVADTTTLSTVTKDSNKQHTKIVAPHSSAINNKDSADRLHEKTNKRSPMANVEFAASADEIQREDDPKRSRRSTTQAKSRCVIT